MDRRRALLASASSGGGIPNNEIWYTSSDGEVIEPYGIDNFGARFESNTYENGKGVIKFNGNVTSISNSAFYECSSLTKVTIPNSVTSIGAHAFRSCSSLTKVTIPNSVISIGNNAFDSCSSLTNVSIGNSVTSIAIEAFRSCSNLTKVTIPNSVTSIGRNAFDSCSSLTNVSIGNSVTSIGDSAFRYCSSLTKVTIPNSVISIGNYAFGSCSSLTSIISNAITAPTIQDTTFAPVKQNGMLYYPIGSDYSSWLSRSSYYLGYYGWAGQPLYTPTSYYDLTITADDVSGKETTTTIYWSCLSDGFNTIDGTQKTGVILTGTAISAEFPQNTSTTKTVKRTITFEYQGLTATTTITQGVWVENKTYTIDLNSQWRLSSSITNPNASAYDGVYESFSNQGVDSSQAVMYLDIDGYDTFKIYIRSYAESSYDYVMASQPDQSINNNTSYSDTSLIKAHTRGSQNSGTSISSYQLVEYTGLKSGKHRITILYRKDVSASSGDDRGYVLIPKNQ